MLPLESQRVSQNSAFVSFCYITNHLMTGPLRNSEVCSLESQSGDVSLDFISGNIEIREKQNLLVRSGPVILSVKFIVSSLLNVFFLF